MGVGGCMYMHIKYMEKSDELVGVILKIFA